MLKFFVIFALVAIGGASCAETTVAITSTPHTISVQKGSSTTESVGICAGSIISKDWVVTAASCFDNSANLRSYYILAGTNDRTSGGTIHEVSKIEIHAKFANTSTNEFMNDIALIKVEKSFVLDESRRAATLTNKILPRENMPVDVSGWGTNKTSIKVPTILHILTEKILANSACQKYYKSRIPENQFCTTHTKDKYFDKHELGNPIVVKDRLIGIGTWSSLVTPCTGKPNVFTDISKYYSWIASKMA